MKTLLKWVLVLATLGMGAMVVREGLRARTAVEPIDVREGEESPRGWALVARTPQIGVTPNPHMVARLNEPMWVRDLGAWVPREPSGPSKLVAYLWAAPITLVGSTLGLLSGGKPVVTNGTVQWRAIGGWFGNHLNRINVSAITFGHSQLYTEPEPPEDLIRHETVHTRQTERLGLAFGPLYWWCQLAFGYGRNPLEKAARRGARQDSGSPVMLGAGSTEIV
ncbi:hypothetical protein [Stomatohabitans albus]|uniref:hypothetical protein n=1 Tax=Stomatohabitans albus TaxID=3110766 RepID=UPI00300DAA73